MALALALLASPSLAAPAPRADRAWLHPADQLADVRFADEGSDGDDAGGDTTTNSAGTGDEGGASARSRRGYLIQINPRVRWLTVPDSFLDGWAYDIDDPGANPYKRPSIRAWTFGAELVFDHDGPNYVLWAEYVHPRIDEGYWDDVDDAFVDHEDGEWIQPDGLGAGAFGFTYLHDIVLVPTGPDGGAVGFSIVVGAGVGVMPWAGGITFWQAGGNPDNVDVSCGPTEPAYERKDHCVADGDKLDRVFPVFPVIDIPLGIRFDFSDHAQVRIDGGIHGVLYLGAAAGVAF